jgi:hypothetical protein
MPQAGLCENAQVMPAGVNLSPQSAKSESRNSLTKPSGDLFSLSFEEQSLRNKKTRYHWMICSTTNPDLLVSWGYAPTHEVAEIEAMSELEDLVSGRTQGGRVASSITPFTRRRIEDIHVAMPSPSIPVLSDSKSLY